MPGRTLDTTEKIAELETLMAGDDAAALLEATDRATLALDFRANDAVLGLPEVDSRLVDELHRRVGEALARAAELGSVEAVVKLAARAFQSEDDALAGAARALLPALGPADPTGAASYYHALLCFHGLGGPQDLVQTVGLHRDAASKGWADAMFELYAMLSRGLGCEPDPNEAIAFCRLAAEAGHPRAMYNLGAFHATGNGAPFDEGESVRWYTAAAERGHGRAAATLGLMRWTGLGAPKDRDQGRAWLARADELGFDWRELAEGMGVDRGEIEGAADGIVAAEPTTPRARAKTRAAKKAPKRPAKKATRTPAKKPATKKPAAKKPAAKKPAAKKPAAKKPAAKKAAAKKPTKKPAAKKAATKKPAAKKPAAKKRR